MDVVDVVVKVVGAAAGYFVSSVKSGGFGALSEAELKTGSRNESDSQMT